MDSVRRWIKHYTPDGAEYRLWEKPLPRLADWVVNCAFYLYASESHARAGDESGGSGFLVHVRSQTIPNVAHLYAVTNSHVLDKGFQTIRLTKRGGGIDTIKTSRQDWIPHPRGWDVEVCPIDIGTTFKWWSVSDGQFISREIIETFNVGLGDDVFLIGRLVTHAGKQRNAPITRFGNISLMADEKEPIRHNDKDQEGFLIECRSLSGFSGSPVFSTTSQSYSGEAVQKIITHNVKGRPRIEQPPNAAKTDVLGYFGGTFGPWLLGIDCAHIPLWKPVFENGTPTKYRVEQNTGIAFVLPAWEILDTLNTRELMKERRKEDQKISKRQKVERSTVPDVSERTFTKADFESALKRVGRKLPNK